MKLLCLGDSLTEGYDIDISKCWPKQLATEINCEVINAGISGDTTTGMLGRFERLLLEHSPTHCIILGGTNDLWFGLKDEFILSNIHALRRQARYHNVFPIIGIPTPCMNLNELNLVHQNYSECIRSFTTALIRYCQEDDQPMIDFSRNIQTEHFLEDALHINEEGQKVMMLEAKEHLLSYL